MSLLAGAGRVFQNTGGTGSRCYELSTAALRRNWGETPTDSIADRQLPIAKLKTYQFFAGAASVSLAAARSCLAWATVSCVLASREDS
jgi:hypothetical protein